MRLEKIVLNGFKSFADKTEFNINCDITAIVGPNGCGKSNVVDAVKWVLGNQSPKSLRSGQMSDVIFSGSASRKPSGMAQVSLVFTNVQGMGIEQDQLEITRRLYRSGESDYQINNKSCRLKDIKELFMDTGVGVSAYSIIEQGQIDQLLHASKVDRRVIFEEAAGISKYKSHKKEATRKLDRTEQNLIRLADIVAEVQKQLRSIKLQAGKARNYLQYSDRLKELRVNYSLAEYDKIVTQLKDKNKTLGSHKQNFSEVVAAVSKNDAALSEISKTILEKETEMHSCDNTLIAAKSRIEQQLERIEFLKTKINELKERKSSAAEQIENLKTQSSNQNKELTECRQQLMDNEEVFEDKNNQLTAIEEQIVAIGHEASGIQAKLEDEKSGIIDIVRRTAHLHNEIQSMGTYRDRMSQQKARLNDRADQAKQQLEEILTDKAQHKTKLDDIAKVISDLQTSLDTKRNELDTNDGEVANINDNLAELKQAKSGLVSEQSVLAEMEAKGQGLSVSLKEILQKQSQGENDSYPFIDGIIADIITAEPDYATAIEASLAGRTDALVVNDTNSFISDKELSAGLKGRVSVICTDRIGPFVNNCDLGNQELAIGRAVEFVNFQEKHAKLAWELLGNTILVRSIEDAVKLSAKLGSGYRFVTPQGEILAGNYNLSIGPVGKGSGLISRKSRLNKLKNEIASISHQIDQAQQLLDKSHQQHDHLVSLCKDLRTAIYEANTEKVDTESKLRLIDHNIERLRSEQPTIAGELENLETEISQTVQKEHDSKQKLEELEEINTERTANIEGLEKELSRKRSQLGAKHGEKTELRVEIGQISEQRRAARQRMATLESQLEHGRIAIESAKNDLAGCDDQVTQTERAILATEQTVSQLYLEKETAQRTSIRMHAETEQLRIEKQQTEQLLKEKRNEQAQIEEQMHQVELELSQLSVKNEDLTQRVSEELNINLAEAYENFVQEDVDWEQVRQEINDLRGKIERLGNVNVDAITEQQSLEERYEFLAKQVEDLNESKKQLEQLIAKINKESRDKFANTFNEVRENFQKVFRKLFGGGKADIMLENPDDVLESGIEIIARPPGKETRTISLLSGGEKTMTAMALLFAVFKSKPSPFCILDEVDAALDEANNERFNMIVKDFDSNSQFIIITHSKRTMSIANMLYGITMQTRGVSKRIAVQFEHVGDDGQVDDPDQAAVA